MFWKCTICLFILYFLQINAQMSTCQSGFKCIILRDCSAALQLIKNKQYPDLCGFQGTQPLVCCPGGTNPERPVGQISEKKCWEYSEAVYDISWSPTFSLSDEPELLNISKCAMETPTFIIGGTDTKEKEFPHMALLGYGEPNNKIWQCGGSLISDQFVLTASHCLASRTYGGVKYIRLGELIISKTNDGDVRDFTIAQIINHPEYKPPLKYNDIALLKMNEPIKFNSFIRPACLHWKSEINDDKLIATGWGLTEVGGQKLSDHLQKVTLEPFSKSDCNFTYKNTPKRNLNAGIVDTQLCAGGKAKEVDTCQGDSGGPLQIVHPKVHCMYSVVGVTSFGKTCGIKGLPGIYTRVFNYIKWIEDIVWPQ